MHTRNARAALAAAAVIACALLITAPAHAGRIVWQGSGAFEACLDEVSETWLNEQAEGIVNAEERVKTLDDVKVAGWTLEAIKGCSGKGKPASADNEAVFAKFMAHWRQHLYELAAVIRAKGGSD